MTTLIIILIVIVLIAVLARNSKKKTHFITSRYTKNNNRSTNNKLHVHTEGYIAESIQRTGLQVLETIHIIATSKAMDTIKGPFEFLLEIIGTLQKGQNNTRYLSDIQKSIDKYKSVFYDRVPQDFELAVLFKPTEFNLIDFYCKSLFAAFKRNVEEHSEQIKLLKRENAKVRRKEKIKEITRFTKDELNNRCSSAPSFADVINELEKIERSMSTDNNSISIAIENKSTPPTTAFISIKPKQSASKESEFIINNGSTFELTLLGADISLGTQIQNILLNDNIWDDKKKQQIVALFAEYNLKVKEVEAYKKKYGKIYFDKLESLKNTSTEWHTSGELDKEDLLDDFREIAIKEIYEKANCDLVSLFEKEPADITVDDALIKEYGFVNIQTYLRFADNLNKVRVIPNDNYSRQKFEKLVDLGLSIRGSSISLEEILFTLTLKDLNEIANNPQKQFKRKNQAVEFILAIPNMEEKIGSKISLRELFKLKPLPEKFAYIDLKEVSDAWSYTSEVVKLLVDTYRSASYATNSLKDKEYVKEYQVEYWGKEESMCPCAKDLVNKKYPRARPPKIPYHIGCNCSLRQEYDFN